ncbi:hypothetical protein ACOALA_20650 (plasmid) [Alicyclobacillus acidoterrestris]|uniref:hypothetical protein n=1 Tax=Alicyclobacillus acidoterrestris TaxID=1450 RepID=UPI003F538B0E
MKIRSLFFVGLSVIGLSGCGHQQQDPSSQNLQQALPKSISATLSAPKTRLRQVNELPISRIGIHSLKTQSNVLYIAPDEVYAINQFRSIWPQLAEKPTVVWTNTTSNDAKNLWTKAGYTGDPLPSDHTYYTSQSIPTPDAYHLSKSSQWQEEPGVLKDEYTYWVSFFSHK